MALIAVRVFRSIALATAVLIACTRAIAQGDPEHKPDRDLELWLSAALDARPFDDSSGALKNLRASLEAGYRSNENLGNGKNTYLDLGWKYKLAKWARLGVNGRYNMRDRTSSNSFRIDGGPTFSLKAGKFDLDYRMAWQHEFIPVYRVRDYVRSRVGVGLRVKGSKIDPFVGCETFTAMVYSGNYFAGIRYDLGVKWNLKGDHALDITLRHDREIGVAAPLYRTIIVLAYEFSWAR